MLFSLSVSTLFVFLSLAAKYTSANDYLAFCLFFRHRQHSFLAAPLFIE